MKELKIIDGEIVEKEITTLAKDELEFRPIKASASRAARCAYARNYDSRMQKELDREELKQAIFDYTVGGILLVNLMIIIPMLAETLIG